MTVLIKGRKHPSGAHNPYTSEWLDIRAGRMPETSRRTRTMTTLDKETEAWLAIRKEAAKAIDPLLPS